MPPPSGGGQSFKFHVTGGLASVRDQDVCVCVVCWKVSRGRG
ncbi:hypothetical protein Hanom_Chr15g01382001 [Helianthus anomalus]